MTLNELHEILLDWKGDSVADALFILIDHMVEAGDSNISVSDDDIGIDITDTGILVCNIRTGEDIAVLTLNLNKDYKGE